MPDAIQIQSLAFPCPQTHHSHLVITIARMTKGKNIHQIVNTTLQFKRV